MFLRQKIYDNLKKTEINKKKLKIIKMEKIEQKVKIT